MTYDPDDKRALFQRVIDDITGQIMDGTLKAGDRLPSAKEISDRHNVSTMTSQRALRELQTMGLTYGMAGKGTFLRPEAVARLTGKTPRVQDPLEGRTEVADPVLNARLADYLIRRERLTAQLLQYWDARETDPAARQASNKIVLELRKLKTEQVALQDEIDHYEGRLASWDRTERAIEEIKREEGEPAYGIHEVMEEGFTSEPAPPQSKPKRTPAKRTSKPKTGE